MRDKVSIIIPVYNAEEYVHRSINSCINQTYKNLEIIVINDGSTDKSENIILKYKDARIVYISKKNSGVSDTRNLGLNKATGKYIMFLDADDWFYEDAVEKMLSIIKTEKVDAVRFNYRLAIRNGNKIRFKDHSITDFEKEGKTEITLSDVLYGNVYCYVWLLIIKKASLKKNIKFDLCLSMMEDNDFFIQMLLNGLKIKYCNLKIYNYFMNNQSASLSPGNYIRNGKNIIYLQKKTILSMKQMKKFDIELEKAVNTNTIKLISNIIKDLYKCNKNDFNGFFKYIIDDSEFIKSFQRLESKKLNITQKIIVFCIKKRLKKILEIFLSIRFFAVKVLSILK